MRSVLETNGRLHTSACVLAVGDELVLGQKLDSNSRWISERLMDLGVPVREHATVGDDVDAVSSAIRRLAGVSPLVVVTGGLGPTQDDLTRDGLARAGETGLVEDEDAWRDIVSLMRMRGRDVDRGQRRQVLRPVTGACLRNEHGTAPGLWCPVDAGGGGGLSDVVCLPGPPREMRPMFEREVLGGLRGQPGRVVLTRLVHVFGLRESQAAEMLTESGDLLSRDRNPLVGITASGGVLTLRVRYEGLSSASAAREAVDETVSAIRGVVGAYVFGEGEETLASVVVDALRDNRQSVGVVESCTGGGVGRVLTGVPGSSEVFEGGFVTYSNRLKGLLAGVDAGLIDTHGAVSREVAEAMARGGLERLGTDHCVSVTGIAGPGGGSESKPAGTVWVCVASTDGTDPDCRCFLVPGTRADVRDRSAMLGLGILRWRVLGARAPVLLWQVNPPA